MSTLIVGDVHGCFNTLKELLTNWHKDDETLVFVGDLIDRGNFSLETVRYVLELKQQYQNKVVLVLGNHEYEYMKYTYNEFEENWLYKIVENLKIPIGSEISPKEQYEFFKTFLLKYENNGLLVTHAGISDDTFNPYELDTDTSVIWNRSKIKNVGKIQVYGHTPKIDGPYYYKESNSYNIDTAAVFGMKLTGIRFDDDDKFIEFVSVKTNPLDIN